MNKETAARILSEYKKNEELNYHSENYLLLAKSFQDENAIFAAELNLKLTERQKYYTETGKWISENAYATCNHYYYQLTELAK